jgi:hypothetical protein
MPIEVHILEQNLPAAITLGDTLPPKLRQRDTRPQGTKQEAAKGKGKSSSQAIKQASNQAMKAPIRNLNGPFVFFFFCLGCTLLILTHY